ncbi:hypothetical protein ACFZAR_19370 [Streptomyces sp. NPDC008222]|uniref:hypothetical protein n=1 Tax=Streptomyces sp. NPDC008222 TaxID=3364820 RepID=UPI0036E62EE5
MSWCSPSPGKAAPSAWPSRCTTRAPSRPEFQAALIARLAAWEASAAPKEPYPYYRLWLAALEEVLADVCAVSTDEITTRAQTLAQRPPGHDHRDHHGHHDHPH